MSAEPAWQVLTLQRKGGLRVRLADLGATWLGCEVPMGGGQRREVLLGHGSAAQQLAQPGYLGATVGRYANRIAGARVVLGGRERRLAANERGHTLHGGPEGFDRRRWQVLAHSATQAVFALHSPDGDQGFPGAVDARVTYSLDDDGLALQMHFEATVSAPTPLALTNHAYFNLDGAPGDVRRHRLKIAAAAMQPVDAELIPVGDAVAVAGGDFDFRRARRIGSRFLASEQQRLAGGYDHAWRLTEAAQRAAVPAAELTSADGRLAARLFTDQPALQVYTGNHLEGVEGRSGPYARHDGIALEPGLPADSPNRPHRPGSERSIARPGVPWQARLRWQFLPRPTITA